VPEPDRAGALAPLAAAGDHVAADNLIEEMRPLIVSLARRFEGRVPRADLEQAGVVGVLVAARRFDPERGTPFGAYATPFAVGEMLACVRQLAAPVRMPRRIAERGRDIERAVDRLTAQLGRSPTVGELSEATGFPEEEVLDALRARMAARAVPLAEAEADELALDDEALRTAEERLDLGAKLDRLDTRSKQLVALRFGVGLSQREIAKRVGISQMHVSRLLRAALAELEDG
jgi:RNA polymerase sigma-B factor